MGIARNRSIVLGAALLIALSPRVAFAQDTEPPVIIAAETMFESGLELFESGHYVEAANRFRQVSDRLDFNRKSTAAMLMAGKAMYRSGLYDESIRTLERLVRRFPSSRYVEAARRTIALAERAGEGVSDDAPISIGIMLPTSDEDVFLTQSMFNGIRIAVDQHNATNPDVPVRMVFRESRPGQYDATMAEFADDGVVAVIGPLYSSEAVDAAEAAEDRRIVMIAPLATDEGVSNRRDYVFQANPTGAMRGRAMARFAVESLRHSKLALIGEDGNELSERMAEGFEDEALRLGAELQFVEMLPATTSWMRLGDHIEADTLIGVQAVYLPITGGQARSLIKAAMDAFDDMDVPLRLLGNKEWHELPSRVQASRYNTVYTTDFHLLETDPRVETIRSEYGQIADTEPNDLAFVGYDLARYLTHLMSTRGRQPMHEMLREAPPYNGVAQRFDFREGNVNSAIFFLRYQDGRAELLN